MKHDIQTLFLIWVQAEPSVYRSHHPYWSDGEDPLPLDLRLEAGRWHVRMEGDRLHRTSDQGYERAEAAAWAAVAAVIDEVAAVAYGGLNLRERETARRLLDHWTGDAVPRLLASLTPTELTVFEYIGQGLTSPQIAALMHRSVKTIDSHACNISDKLGHVSRPRLVALAARALCGREVETELRKIMPPKETTRAS